LNTRLKELRHSLNLTQAEFAKRIGTVQNTITGYESGRRNPSNPVISAICKEFNVNEEWLRTGEGDMFVKDNDVLLSQLTKKYNLDDSDRKFMERFLALPDEQRKAVLNYANFLASTLSNAELSAELAPAPRYELSDPATVDVDTETASYRRELEAQKKAAENSSALDGAKNA
jgi:transcriptional regulator with XRE-family HTH domain